LIREIPIPRFDENFDEEMKNGERSEIFFSGSEELRSAERSHQQPGVNFINILLTKNLYKRRFSTYM